MKRGEILVKYGSSDGHPARIVGKRFTAKVTLSESTGTWQSHGGDELEERVGDLQEWQVGLEEALGLRTMRPETKARVAASIQIVDARNWALVGSASPPYMVVLEWSLNEPATMMVGPAGENVLYSPAGLLLIPEPSTFDACIPLFQHCLQVLNSDLTQTLCHVPREIAVHLLRRWEEWVVAVQRDRAVELARERIAPYRIAGKPYTKKPIDVELILKRMRYLIAALDYGVWVEFISKDHRGFETVLRGTYEALAGHLRALAFEELPGYLGVTTEKVLAPLRDLLGLPPLEEEKVMRI